MDSSQAVQKSRATIVLAEHDAPLEVADGLIKGCETGLGSESPASTLAIADYYYRFADDPVKGAKYAKESFSLQPCVTAAGIILATSLEIHSDIPDEVLSFARNCGNSQLDIYLADIERARGNDTAADVLLMKVILKDDKHSKTALSKYVFDHLSDSNRSNPIKVIADTSVVLSRMDDCVVTISFHAESSEVSREGVNAVGSIHYTSDSPEFYNFYEKTIGSGVFYKGEEYVIMAIEPIMNPICRHFFDIAKEEPGVTLIHFDPNDPDSFVELLKELTPSKSPLDYYINGYPLPNGDRLYLGIETGVFGTGEIQLMFTIQAIRNPDLPFRRSQLGFNCAMDRSDSFLLSYNAVIVLSQMNLDESILETICGKCYVTTETKNRLKLDTRLAFKEVNRSIGRMGVIDDTPFINAFSDTAKEELRSALAAVTSLINRIPATESKETESDVTRMKLLSLNSRGDMLTAISNGSVYVSEDCFESLVADICNEPRRCSIYTLFAVLGFGIKEFGFISSRFSEWGAKPVVDDNVLKAINEVFERFGFIVDYDSD